MQFTYYTTLSLCILTLDMIFGLKPHLGQMFMPSSLDLSEKYSFTTLLANIINIIFVVIAQAFIVEKANKCLDYTLTIFIIHLCSVTIYTKHFPFNFEWWLFNFGIIFVTVLVAEYVLMRIEQ